MYVFAYGSLVNPKALPQTLPEDTPTRIATLNGYRRVFNKIARPKVGNPYLALNIEEAPDCSIAGKVLILTDAEFDRVVTREGGYTKTDVTAKMQGEFDAPVHTFIASEQDHPEVAVVYSYLLTCLDGVPSDERERWLSEIRGTGSPLEDDTMLPRYPRTFYDHSTVTDLAKFLGRSTLSPFSLAK